jgi:membrane peptidoglycan carboxypeptidase
LLAEVGIENTIAFAKKFGINRSLKPYPSLALGTAEATMEENVAAFNVFANHGAYVKPFLVEKVWNAQGRKIWSHSAKKKQVLDAWVNDRMIVALAERMNVARQQMGPLVWLDCESIGKTGSTNGASSVWFLGATPGLTTAVYVGRDDNKQLGQEVFASKMVFPLWFEFNKAVGSAKKIF